MPVDSLKTWKVRGARGLERAPGKTRRHGPYHGGDHAADTILLPKLAKFLPNYPDIKVEIIIDYGLTDIVAELYDAGVRWASR
jgi:DNA-binding transcriptional LysR family regulator